MPRRAEKKREPVPAGTIRVLPMEVRIGDRLADETGKWQVISRPYMSNAGKNAHVRVQRVDQPDVTEIRTRGAHVARLPRRGDPGRRDLRPPPAQRPPDRAKRTFETKGGEARRLTDGPASLRSDHDPPISLITIERSE